ncbi:conserved hypothetical protein [Ricinus communis]|uniref:Uncharacterized protein n=1 Tax=Ricinus communis TaxID=3988 RepID=B9SEA8_RICCO|nr:conserved hypothetical protein [Ricinus communis]
MRYDHDGRGSEMCSYQPWEDDSSEVDDNARRINGMERVDARWETQMAMLEARIANVEARVERLEARMLYLQKGLRVLCGLFLVTLFYAICK